MWLLHTMLWDLQMLCYPAWFSSGSGKSQSCIPPLLSNCSDTIHQFGALQQREVTAVITWHVPVGTKGMEAEWYKLFITTFMCESVHVGFESFACRHFVFFYYCFCLGRQKHKQSVLVLLNTVVSCYWDIWGVLFPLIFYANYTYVYVVLHIYIFVLYADLFSFSSSFSSCDKQ